MNSHREIIVPEERTIRDFWNSHPCGASCVESRFGEETEAFFAAYDEHRYSSEPHILRCLDGIRWEGKDVLEVGLGQGADSEQIIRRGAHWSGLDITAEAVTRVRTRCQVRKLPHIEIREGSILAPPYKPNTFDIVYSHGVLHHVPNIEAASTQIARLLRPGGELVIMLYARWSWHYMVSMGVYSRLLQAMAYLAGRRDGDVLGQGYAQRIDAIGLMKYLRMQEFSHYNTDGADNPYTKIYDLHAVRRDFPDFDIVKAYKRFSPVAPWLWQKKPPFESLLGWNLWVHLKPLTPGHKS